MSLEYRGIVAARNTNLGILLKVTMKTSQQKRGQMRCSQVKKVISRGPE